MPTRRRPCRRLMLATGLLLLAACHRAPERLGITGTVTFDGQPLEAGNISFTPTSDPSRTTGTMVVKGKFSILPDDGLEPGMYTVRIRSAHRPRENGESVSQTSPPGRTTALSIPDRYNQESELTIELQAGGPTNFDFPLTSRR